MHSSTSHFIHFWAGLTELSLLFTVLGVYPCVATESTYYHTLNFLLMVFKLSSFFKGKREIWMSYLKYAKTKIQILLSGQFQELKSN
jgi:hypothetical protein